MRRIIGCFLAFLALLPGVAAAWEARPQDEGYTLMAESESRALLLNEKTLEARLVDRATGLTWDTCVMQGSQGNKTVKNTQKSALNVTYIANAQNGTTSAMDSYSKSVQTGAFSVSSIENGFAVRYLIGDDTFIIDDLPKAIRADKYQRLLDGAGWSSKEKKTFQDNYRAVKIADTPFEYMIRIKDDSLSVLLIKQLWNLIFASGIYTEGDMAEDNAAVHYERSYLPELSVTVRYQLEGDDLVVTVPAGEIESTPENEVTLIELLPYFLSADAGQTGYMLVPDGSGALIYLNNQKLAATSYTARVYGEDALINAASYSAEKENVALPVVGIKRSDSAMLAIIEQGAEICSIFANVSGRSDEFNRVTTRFLLREMENVSLAGNESITSPRYAEDVYTGDIVMRYQWLTDAEADYTDMAKAYRAYLLDRGLLVARESPQNAPFYLELIGAVTKTKFFLGIPYASSVQATTLSQAQVIYEALRARGIEQIQLIYSGLFYGGVKHAALTRPTLDAGVGSAKELAALNARLRENGDTLYAGVYFSQVATKRDFAPLTQAPRKHDGEPAEVFIFGEPVLKRSYSGRASYYISPYYLPDYTKRALNALRGYDLDGLDLFDLGGSLIPDYKRRANLSRIHATPVYQQALESLAGEYSLMLDSPMLYALPYAAHVTGLPAGDNGYRITDAAIPFVQYVLEGCAACSGDSWNLRAYQGMKSQLLWALESKTSPRFTLTWEDPSIFANTGDMDYLSYFSTQYANWPETAGALYAEYNAFYRLVRDAQVVSHEILPNYLRRVTYSNGVTLCLNYGAADALLEGESIPAGGYVIKEGGRPS